MQFLESEDRERDEDRRAESSPKEGHQERNVVPGI
jgi:hypothetical protein